jgi:hypothetical protein
MLLSTARRDDQELAVQPPALGARLPGPRSREHHRDAVALVGEVSALKRRLARDSFLAAAALADSVIAAVADVIGHDLTGHRRLFSEAAHFGGMLAAAEERQSGSEPGQVAPHAAQVLACVESQFSEPDQLAEQLSRWLLEAGYYLVRTGSATQPLLDSLRADLARLLTEVEQPPRSTVRLPRPATAADSVTNQEFAGR